MNVNPDVTGFIKVVIAWFTLLATKYVFLNLSMLMSLYFFNWTRLKSKQLKIKAITSNKKIKIIDSNI